MRQTNQNMNRSATRNVNTKRPNQSNNSGSKYPAFLNIEGARESQGKLIYFINDILIPFALANKALIVVNGVKSCSFSCALEHVAKLL